MKNDDDITKTKPSRKDVRYHRPGSKNFGFIQIIRGIEVGRFYVMESPGEIVFIGRERTSTFRINHDSVSRTHVSIQKDDHGGYLLKDEGSTNGTIVDGTKIEKITLYPGQKFYIGDILLKFDLVDQAEIEFQNVLYARSVEARLDPLTNLLSKRYFLEEMPHLIEYFHKKKASVCLAMIDIDHFKQINDKHGHQFGDEILAAVGRIILASIRENDIPIRYGGEEILILLIDITEEAASEVANRLRKEIRKQLAILHEVSVGTSISIGLTALQTQDTKDSFLKRADDALYQSKANGRDRMTIL